MTVRTRFAPSPTGYLHIGSARTALFAWLYARRFQGEFVLRIEDTDLERSTTESAQAILAGLAWLGIDYDEGPFYQSERFARYRELIEQLLASGHAYRCTCTKERLAALRETQLKQKQKARYDGHCRDLNLQATNTAHVIRFRTPQSGDVTFQDAVRGQVTVNNHELDDLVLVRSDGVPTYNFTVVCDDWEMNISHVIRGDDHINNTPRQMHILDALGAPRPIYAHLPMILGTDGKRLSKRHGAVSVMHYRDAGYLPQALCNYLVRLGWSHGDQEIFSREEMIAGFDLSTLSKSGALVNQEKLDWLNQHYLKTEPRGEVCQEFSWQLQQLGVTAQAEDHLAAVLESQLDRGKTLAQIATQSLCFFQDFEDYDIASAAKFLTPQTRPILEQCQQQFAELATWTAETIHQVIMNIMHTQSLKLPKIAQPLRVATTGSTKSPSIDITLALLGKARVLARLQTALDWIKD
jgi:glutamyl-tRNA synthetase